MSYEELLIKIKNPHDALFQRIMTEKQNAIDFVKGFFPQEIKTKLNFESFELDTSTYTGANLRRYFSDVFYNCSYQGETQIKLAFLFEHKSRWEENPYMQPKIP